MRLSKNRKKILAEHKNLKLDKEELKELRAERKRENRVKYKFLSSQKERINPKHVRSALRKKINHGKFEPLTFTQGRTKFSPRRTIMGITIPGMYVPKPWNVSKYPKKEINGNSI